MDNREDLIMQLASSMGHGAAISTLHGPSRYDAGTRTLYCEGKVIGKESIEEAKVYFEDQRNYLKSGTNASIADVNTYITYYDAAIEAINWMLNQKEDLGR